MLLQLLEQHWGFSGASKSRSREYVFPPTTLKNTTTFLSLVMLFAVKNSSTHSGYAEILSASGWSSLRNVVLSVSLQAKLSSGTGLSRCYSFPSMQAAKLVKTYLVHLSLPAGTTPFESTASSSSTKVEKHLQFPNPNPSSSRSGGMVVRLRVWQLHQLVGHGHISISGFSSWTVRPVGHAETKVRTTS